MGASHEARQIIVGHADTIHDAAVCVLEDDEVLAESLERHMQSKRAWEADLYDSARALIAALSDRRIWPVS